MTVRPSEGVPFQFAPTEPLLRSEHEPQLNLDLERLVARVLGALHPPQSLQASAATEGASQKWKIRVFNNLPEAKSSAEGSFVQQWLSQIPAADTKRLLDFALCPLKAAAASTKGTPLAT